ncbi:MAG: hypothetical protein V3U89_02825 [Methylophilaceae bacterium]
MLAQHYLKKSFTIFIRLLLICAAIIPSVALSGGSDGVPFTPNTFDVEIATMSRNDLHVYSQNHRYTELGLYRDLPFTTNVSAALGNRARLSSIDVSVKAKSIFNETSFQPVFSVSPAVNGHQPGELTDYPSTGRMSWLHQRADLDHRVLARFAIEACRQNADSWVNGGNSIESHFSRDHILQLNFEYRLKLNSWWHNRHPNTRIPLTQENSGTYTRLVRTEKNIVCHSNTARAPRPPSNQFVVHQVKFNFYPPRIKKPGQCRVGGRFEFRTNTPHKLIRFKIVHEHNRQDYNYVNYSNRTTRPSVISADENGIASGRWGFTVPNRRGAGYQQNKIGRVRIIGTSEAFESELLTYEKNCNAPGVDVDIKKLRVNPKLRIPKDQFPGHAPIVRPGAPDTRLQQSGNTPVIKLDKPNTGIKKHQLPNSAPAIKPVEPSSRILLPKQAPAIKSGVPDSQLKQLQPPKNAPALEPVLEKGKTPTLKPGLKKIN